MSVLKGLQPQSVFYYFEQICDIPHGSGNTKAISDYCVEFARARNLTYIQDEKNNVTIFKDASEDSVSKEPVILQGHLDMVCESEDPLFDFTKQGLKLELNQDIITAKNTTLGGDDGIAVAYALAILDDDTLSHPPLEVVFTVDEEIGMLGAVDYDASALKGRRMLNIDSEEEGYLLVSCAGGTTVNGRLELQRQPVRGAGITITVEGLLGGHSGVEIDKGRANADVVLGKLLSGLLGVSSYALSEISGGTKKNAIPKMATAQIVLPDEDRCENIVSWIYDFEKLQKEKFATTDPGLCITVRTEEECSRESFSEADTVRIVGVLSHTPSGVHSMSQDIDGLVETSSNLGIVKSELNTVDIVTSVRSSVETEKQKLTDQIAAVIMDQGGTVQIDGVYPAWEYKKDSPLRETMVSTFVEQYGREPVVQSIHAGVECGLFSEKIPGLDCVSFGPDMKDIHTTDESMDVKSVARTWEYLLRVLEQLAKEQ